MRFIKLRTLLVASSYVLSSGGIEVCIAPPRVLMAQDVSGEDSVSSAEEKRQKQIIDRFQTLLEKSPRRGTALDRVYGHHIEYGTLEDFIAQLKKKTQSEPNNGSNWQLLGLFESQRGNESEAIAAFEKASSLNPGDALPSFYRGQVLLLNGQQDLAVEAFEESLARKPDRADLIEIFQQLGRVHQRAQRKKEALEVWRRLEELFPNDARVLEQIATTLADEGEDAEALKKYQQLIGLVKDDYRKTTFRIQMAELQVRLGKKAEGLTEFETLLSDLNPESWLYHDVRRRIENVYLKSGDQDGLVSYYEGWLKKNPEDLEAMARLAKYLAGAARVPEATQWLETALKKAPTRTQLRRAFIEQLIDRQEFSEAAAQYELLAAAAPGNIDVLRDWGRIVLRDRKLPEDQRKTEASRIWKKILEAHPKDSVTIAQVADFFRHARMNDEALELYQKAVEQSPNDPQYREYLGEYYHVLKRPEDALKTWDEIAAGDRENALNVTRLAEVLSQFGYQEPALVKFSRAIELDPKDIALQLKAARVFTQEKQFQNALACVNAAEKLAANDDEKETVFKERIAVLQASETLSSEIEKLTETLKGRPEAATEDWLKLARYQEAARDPVAASQAIETALKKNPQSIPIVAAAARIAESSGDLGKAVSLLNQLTTLDRRERGDYLMAIARLELQQGRPEEALKAAKELIISAPGKTDNYEFYAKICFQLGKPDEGLDALRKAFRIAPNEPHLVTALASALAEQFKTTEAIEVYWKAFDKTDEVEDQLTLITKITELATQLNQFERVIERLERERRSDEKRRNMTLTLAQAYHTVGDTQSARVELESLLTPDTRDTELLQQLSKLCEQEQDFASAVQYQRQLVAIAPVAETEFRLAQLYTQSGNDQEAQEILTRLTQKEEDPVRFLKSVDTMINQNSTEAARTIVESALRERPNDWELLYREGVLLEKSGKQAEAQVRFKQILDLNLPPETLGAIEREQHQKSVKNAKSSQAQNQAAQLAAVQNQFFAMAQMEHQIRTAIGLAGYAPYGSVGSSRLWTPSNYGQARAACLGWQLKFAQVEKKEDSFLKRIELAASEEAATGQSEQDWLLISALAGQPSKGYEIFRKNAERGGIAEKAVFLTQLNRLRNNAAQAGRSQGRPEVKPLSDEDVDFVLKCLKEITESTKAKSPIPINSPFAQFFASPYMQIQLFQAVLPELKIAGRQAEADELMNEMIAGFSSEQEIAIGLSLAVSSEQFDKIPMLLERYEQAVKGGEANSKQVAATPSFPAFPPQFTRQMILEAAKRWMGKLAAEHQDEEERKLFARVASISIESLLKEKANQPAGQNAASRAARTTMSGQRRNSSSANVSWGSVWYGNEQQGIQFTAIFSSEYLDGGLQQLLLQLTENAKKNETLPEVEPLLRSLSDQAQPTAKPYYTSLLVNYLWSVDQKDDALDLYQKFLTGSAKDPAMQLQFAELLLLQKREEEGLKVVTEIVATDPTIRQRKELLTLSLAESLGDNDLAQASAERLFGMRLDLETQLGLIPRLQRLGLDNQAQAIAVRSQKQAGNRIEAITNLMMMARARGDVELANRMALSVLQRTSATAGQARNRMFSSYESADSNYRNQAIQLLGQTGGLKLQIEKLEQQLKTSPDSIRLYQQLIEYAQASNDKQKVKEIFQQAIKRKTATDEFKSQYVKVLYDNGQFKEACDHLIPLLKAHPEWFTNDFYQVHNIFSNAQRSKELVEVVLEMDLKHFRDPWALIEFASSLLQNSETRETGAKFAKKVIDTFPDRADMVVQNIHQDEFWKSDIGYELGLKALIPPPGNKDIAPWFGFSRVNSFGQDGQLNSFFDKLTKGAKASGRVEDLRTKLQERVKEYGHWKAGQAMLALFELQAGNRDQGAEKLSNLFNSEQSIKDADPNAAWVIGVQLIDTASTRPMAEKLLLAAVNSGEIGLNELQYRPEAALIRLYQATGQKDKARELLLKKVHPRNLSGNADYEAYQQLQSGGYITEKLNALGLPFDALKFAIEIHDNELLFVQASRVFGNPQQVDRFREEFKQHRETATRALLKSTASQSLDSVLPLVDVSQKTPFQLDLIFTVKRDGGSGVQSLDSVVYSLLKEWSKTEADRDAVQKRLDAIHQAVPENLAVQALRLRLSLESVSGAVPESLQEELNSYLATVVKTPLDEIPGNRKPNQRQIQQAQQLLPIWLVAENCLSRPSLSDIGTKLAGIATAAAKRLDNQGPANAMVQKWLQIASTQSDQREFGGIAQLGLEAVAGRPSTSTRVVPLKMSQFSACIAIARRCAESGFKELSLKAVQQAMAGGLPIPDQASVENNQATVRQVRPGSNTGAPIDNVISEVSRELLGILTLWESRQYSPVDIEALLRAAVFPENRVTEIVLFPSGAPQFGDAADSLGNRLVHWSAKAGTLDSLKETTVSRKQSGPKAIPALVLLTLIDIERNDLASVRKHLAELSSLSYIGSAEEDLIPLGIYPAFKHRELAKELAPLAAQTQLRTLQRQVERTDDDLASPLSGNPGAVVSMLKLLQAAGKHEELVRYVDGLVAARQKSYSRFGGGYGVFVQMNDNARIADALAGIGEMPMALDFLGRVVDYDSSNFGRPSVQTSLVSLALALQQKTASEREQIWRKWTLPDEARQNYRFISQIVLPANVPDLVIESGGIASPRAYREIESKTFLDNFSLLISAAKDCGKFDELKQQVQSSLATGGLNSQFLWMMILAEAGDEKTLSPLLKAEIERANAAWLNNQSRRSNTDQQSVALLLKLREKNLVKAQTEAYATQIGRRLHLWFEQTYGTELHVNLAKKLRLERGGSEVVSVPQFKNWIDATQQLSAERQATMPRWWGVPGHDLYQVISPIYSHLILKTPLTGNWSCEFDITMGSSEELGIGFDGCRLNISSSAVHQIQSTTRHEELKSFNFGVSGSYSPIKLRIDSIDGVLKYYVNGTLAAEQTIHHSSPWLDMKFGRNGVIKVSEPRFLIKPQVLDTVPLFSNGRMDYWDGSLFANRLVQYRAIEGVSQGMTSTDLRLSSNASIVRPGSSDWEVVDDVLIGRSRTEEKPQVGTPTSNPSSSERFIAYHRPVQAGDRIEYEFWYEAGFSEVHPVVGRMAFLLSPNGVQLHWLAKPGWDTSVLGIGDDNRIDDPNLKQVAATLPLKTGEWNKAVLEVETDSISLSVNGTVAFRRPRDHATLEQFGLYHNSRTDVKVRKATLTGSWHKEIKDATDVSWATVSPLTPEERFQLLQQIPAAFTTQEFLNSVLKARVLPGDQAYLELKDWVLPETRPQLIRGNSSRAPIGSSTSKLMTDSELLSPLWELVKSADAAHKLDELKGDIAQIPDEATTRGEVEALNMLVALRQKRFDEVNAHLNGLTDHLKKNPPKKGEAIPLPPAFVVAWFAAEHPETCDASESYVTEQRKADRIRALFGSEVERKHRSLAHHATLQKRKLDQADSTAFNQWTAIYQPSRNTRMTGAIPGTWHRHDGMVGMIADENVSRLMFNIPLKGNFEIESLRSTHGYQELNIVYGGFSADPRYDRKALKLGEFGKQREVAGALDIPDYKAFANYRIVVDPQTITTFINGVKIHEQKYDQQVEPWLMLAPLAAGYQPQIKSLKITGSPVIPESIELFNGQTKQVWNETYFNNTFNRNGSSAPQGRSTTDWTFVGDELIGQKVTGKSGESPGYLWYHRPMLEDGEFTFESFYVPGEKEIAPVVGKKIFLLKPDGLTLKTLVDPLIALKPQTEDSESKPDHASGTLPLKPNEWNQITVAVRGDVATVTINGEAIGSATLTDRPDQRYIGLYRGLNESGCQVRKMVYRGEWPKSLPPVEQQEFADLGTPGK